MAIAIASQLAAWTPRTCADWNAWIRQESGRRQLLRRVVTEELTGIPADDSGVVTACPRRGDHDWAVLTSWLGGAALCEIAHTHNLSGARGAQKALDRIITRARYALRMDRTEAIILGERSGGAGGRTGRTVNERSGEHAAERARLLGSIRERLERLSERLSGCDGHQLSRAELAELDAALAALEALEEVADD